VIRVGFDGRALSSPAAGVRRYAHELFGALALLDRDVQVVAVGADPASTLPARIERADGAAALPGNAGWMLTGLGRAARRARLDLLHAPSYTAPLGGPRPLVLTIHDVSYERHPEWYPYRRDPLRRAFYRWSAHTADRIITDSTFSKQEILSAYGLPAERVDVVPLAASAPFTPGARNSDSATPSYVLHVGDLHPRRNVETALGALVRVRERQPHLADMRLVLAGVDRGVADSLASVAASLAPGRDVLDLRGRIPEAELVALYRGAAALVYPSRYEGFGLPLLEAMACGTPVIASRAASIPEVVGDAALLVDPDDVDGWADAIEAVSRAEISTAMRAAGLARAAGFSWRRTAEETLAVYERTRAGARR
jgi:glycosyltransferase involved in cell wall biosynthesis